MLCEPTLANFDKYFGFAYKSGFSPFKWDKKNRIFHAPGTSGKYALFRVYCWWVSMIILIGKTVFLGNEFFGKLVPSGDLAKMVFQVVFMMTDLCAVCHNLIFWKTRTEFTALFRRAVVFSSKAHADYLPQVQSKYPMVNDGLGPNVMMGSGITFMFTISVFFLSLDSPTLSTFFATRFPLLVENYLVIRITCSLFEAYITAFAWIGNIQGAILIPNLAHLLSFWTNELRGDSPNGQLTTDDSKIRNPEEIIKTYRQLQILAIEYNTCFAEHIACLFFTAFINQTSVNYGTLRLYSTLSFVSWVGCPNLAISGTINLFQIHMVLASPFEVSTDAIRSWNDLKHLKNQRVLRQMKKFVKSCPTIRVNHGSFNYFDKGSAIQYIDALIDKTVTLLLWQ